MEATSCIINAQSNLILIKIKLGGKKSFCAPFFMFSIDFKRSYVTKICSQSSLVKIAFKYVVLSAVVTNYLYSLLMLTPMKITFLVSFSPTFSCAIFLMMENISKEY